MEWIDVEDLEDAKDAISKFLELKRTKDKEDQGKETNDENRKIKEKSKIPKKKRTNMGGLTTILTIIQLFLMIMGIQGQSEITTKYKLCTDLKYRYVNIKEICRPPTVRGENKFIYPEFDRIVNESTRENRNWLTDLRNNYNLEAKTANYQTRNHNTDLTENEIRYRVPVAILTKTKNEIQGYGHECKASKLMVTLQMDFLGNKVTPIIFEEQLKVSPDQCRSMSTFRLCGENQMTCNKNICKSKHPDLDNKYSWWNSVNIEYRKCSVEKIEIHSKYKNDTIINNCIPTTGECITPESTVVWNPKELIHTCPYERLGIMNVEYELRRTKENILVSEEYRYAFEVLGKRTVCENLTIYDTTDALEIAIIPNNEVLKMKKSSLEIMTFTKTLQAETDFESGNAIELVREYNKRSCYELKNNLFMKASEREPTIFNIIDYTGETFPLYTESGNIYIPKCESEYTINIRNTNECYKDIPVIAQKDNITVNGFLSTNNLIITESTIINCKETRKIEIPINNDTKIIKMTGKEIRIEHFNKKVFGRRLDAYYSEAKEFELHHFLDLSEIDKNDSNTENKINETSNISEIEEFTDIIEKLNKNGLRSILTETFASTKAIAIITTSIIITIIITVIIILIIRVIIRKRSKTKAVNFIAGLLPTNEEEVPLRQEIRTLLEDFEKFRESK